MSLTMEEVAEAERLRPRLQRGVSAKDRVQPFSDFYRQAGMGDSTWRATVALAVYTDLSISTIDQHYRHLVKYVRNVSEKAATTLGQSNNKDTALAAAKRVINDLASREEFISDRIKGRSQCQRTVLNSLEKMYRTLISLANSQPEMATEEEIGCYKECGLLADKVEDVILELTETTDTH